MFLMTKYLQIVKCFEQGCHDAVLHLQLYLEVAPNNATNPDQDRDVIWLPWNDLHS